ncbi:MAG: hypothetical protein AVDCRST_MAG43-1186, partial [uncultured Thermomicrobiales bacterium]
WSLSQAIITSRMTHRVPRGHVAAVHGASPLSDRSCWGWLAAPRERRVMPSVGNKRMRNGRRLSMISRHQLRPISSAGRPRGRRLTMRQRSRSPTLAVT